MYCANTIHSTSVLPSRSQKRHTRHRMHRLKQRNAVTPDYDVLFVRKHRTIPELVTPSPSPPPLLELDTPPLIPEDSSTTDDCPELTDAVFFSELSEFLEKENRSIDTAPSLQTSTPHNIHKQNFSLEPRNTELSHGGEHEVATILLGMKTSARPDSNKHEDINENPPFRLAPPDSSKKPNPTKSQDNKSSCPSRLALPEDAQELNSLHCFVRSDLLEIFALPSEDFPLCAEAGPVGLRCVFCSHLPRRSRAGATMSSFYPKRISDIYRSVCTFQRVHFKNCRHIPKHVRDIYSSLKEVDKTRGKTKYWEISARQLGLVDDGHRGIRFASNARTQNN